MHQHRTRSMSSDADFQFIVGTILAVRETILHYSWHSIKPESSTLEASPLSRIESLIDSSFVLEELLGHGYQQLICWFNAFVLMKNDNSDPIHGDWQNLATKAEFNEFRIIGFASYSTVTQIMPPATLSSGVGTSGNTYFTTKVRERVFEFKKGIKRDTASFTVMKDSKQWDSVHRTLKTQTCYQDVNDILDPCYRPTTAEDIALFAEKQKYMCTPSLNGHFKQMTERSLSVLMIAIAMPN
jgi:hypothetical protein